MKKKTNIVYIKLFCEICFNKNEILGFYYSTKKNKKNTEKKLRLFKYCKKCNKHQLHVEKS